MSEFNLILLSYVKFRVGQCGKLLQNEPSYLSAVRIHTPMAFLSFWRYLFFHNCQKSFYPHWAQASIFHNQCAVDYLSLSPMKKCFKVETTPDGNECWRLARPQCHHSLYKYITAIQVSIYITLMPLILCPVHLYAYKSRLNLVNR